MNEGNFDYEQITQIRKMCNYRLLAEKQIAQKNIHRKNRLRYGRRLQISIAI